MVSPTQKKTLAQVTLPAVLFPLSKNRGCPPFPQTYKVPPHCVRAVQFFDEKSWGFHPTYFIILFQGTAVSWCSWWRWGRRWRTPQPLCASRRTVGTCTCTIPWTGAPCGKRSPSWRPLPTGRRNSRRCASHVLPHCLMCYLIAVFVAAYCSCC